jgi:hypothetical protein
MPDRLASGRRAGCDRVGGLRPAREARRSATAPRPRCPSSRERPGGAKKRDCAAAAMPVVARTPGRREEARPRRGRDTRRRANAREARRSATAPRPRHPPSRLRPGGAKKRDCAAAAMPVVARTPGPRQEARPRRGCHTRRRAYAREARRSATAPRSRGPPSRLRPGGAKKRDCAAAAMPVVARTPGGRQEARPRRGRHARRRANAREARRSATAPRPRCPSSRERPGGAKKRDGAAAAMPVVARTPGGRQEARPRRGCHTRRRANAREARSSATAPRLPHPPSR